jgi:hypothetical protein
VGKVTLKSNGDDLSDDIKNNGDEALNDGFP